MDRHKETESITEWQTRNFERENYSQPDDSDVVVRMSQELQKQKLPRTGNYIRFGSFVLGFLFCISSFLWVAKWLFISFHWFDLVILSVYSTITVAQIRFDVNKKSISE